MSKLYNGGASFGFSLNYNTAVPVDTRSVVASLQDLLNPETWVSGSYDANNDANNVYVVYPGLQVTVNSEKTIYVFVADTVSKSTITSEASWSKLSNAATTGNAKEAVDKVEASVGLAEDGSHKKTDGTFTSEATTITEEIAALDKALNDVTESVGNKSDDKTENTVYGKIAKVQDSLDTEKKKFTDSATITVGDTTYETALTLKYVPAVSGDDADSAVAAHIALADKNGKELSTVNIDSIVGNGTLKSSSYDKDTGILTLTWNKSDGKTTDTQIDLGAMLDVNDVLIDEASKNYLDVDLSGGENSQAVFKVKTATIGKTSATSTGLADAKDVKDYVEDTITSLTSLSKTTDGDNVHVTVSQKNGLVSIDSVTEDYVTVTEKQGDYASTPGTPPTFKIENESGLVNGTALGELRNFALHVSDFSTAVLEKNINAKTSTATGSDGDDTNGPKVTVKVDTEGVGVSGVTVTTSDIASKSAHEALDTYVKGEKVTGDDGSVSGGIEKRLAVLETSSATKDFTSSIDKKDASEFVNVVVSQGRDGKLISDDSSLSVTYASYKKDGEVVTDGIAKGSLVKEIAKDLVDKAVDSLDITAALEASDDDTNPHITVSIDQENGKIKDLIVKSDDIASAGLLGKKTDASTVDTAFGRIAAETRARTEAIEALDAEEKTTGTNVTVGVTETDGLITKVDVTEKYSTVTRIPKGQSTTESLTITDKTGLVTGTDLEKAVNYAKDVVDRATEDLEVTASGDSFIEAAQSSTDKKKIEINAVLANVSDEAHEGLVSNTDVRKNINQAKADVEALMEWIEID